MSSSHTDKIESNAWLDHLQPGKIDLVDFIIHFGFQGDYDDKVYHNTRTAFLNLLDTLPNSKPALVATALWVAQGLDGRLPYNNKAPLERKFLRFLINYGATDKSSEDFYLSKNSLHLNPANEKIGSSLIHELFHALANLAYQNHGDLFYFDDDEKMKAWSHFAILFNKEVKVGGALSFSHYPQHEWPSEIVARIVQYLSLYPSSPLPIPAEILNFIMKEYQEFFKQLNRNISPILLAESGICLLSSFKKGFFKDSNEILITPEDLTILKETRQKKMTVLDWHLKQLIEEKKSVQEIYSALKKEVSDEALLFAACRVGLVDLLPLLKPFSDVNKTEALTLAAKYKQHLMVDTLIQNYHADPTELDSSGLTAAHYAASNGDLPLLKQLSKNMDIDLSHKLGQSLLEAALHREQPQVIAFLIDRQLGESSTMAITMAIQLGRAKMMAYLVKHYKIDENLADLNGFLKLAFNCKAYECMNSLLQMGANPAILIGNKNVSMVQEFAAFNDPKVIEVLLNTHSIVDKDGLIAFALTANETTLGSFMKDNKHLINSTTESGQTLMHLLILFKKHELASLLFKEYGADINIQDNFGTTPLDLAKDSRFGSFSLAKSLTATKPIYPAKTVFPIFVPNIETTQAPQEEFKIEIKFKDK